MALRIFESCERICTTYLGTNRQPKKKASRSRPTFELLLTEQPAHTYRLTLPLDRSNGRCWQNAASTHSLNAPSSNQHLCSVVPGLVLCHRQRRTARMTICCSRTCIHICTGIDEHLNDVAMSLTGSLPQGSAHFLFFASRASTSARDSN